MKYLQLILLLPIGRVARAHAPELEADESIPIPKVTFDDKGDFVLKASPTSAASDFDFSGGQMEDAQSSPEQTLGELSGVDGVRFGGRESGSAS